VRVSALFLPLVAGHALAADNSSGVSPRLSYANTPAFRSILNGSGPALVVVEEKVLVDTSSQVRTAKVEPLSTPSGLAVSQFENLLPLHSSGLSSSPEPPPLLRIGASKAVGPQTNASEIISSRPLTPVASRGLQHRRPVVNRKHVRHSRTASKPGIVGGAVAWAQKLVNSIWTGSAFSYQQ